MDKLQVAINQLTKLYTDFLDSNEPKEKPGLYREVAAILGVAITRIETLKTK